jgi:NitT/TauT family transport system substrate-binding protein
VKIAFVPGSIGFADVLIAEQKGFFAEEGLSVELVGALNGSLAHNALISGAVDFAPLAGGYVPFVRPAGIFTQQVAARTEQNGFALVVRKGLEDDVRTVADLKDRRIAVEALGSTITWAMAVNYLTKAGLNFERDVQLIALSSRAAELAALESGRADAAILDGPADVQLVAAGKAFRLVDPLEPTDHLLWVGSAREDALAWITREDVIQERPELVRAVVNAAGKALAYLRARSEQDALADVAAELRPFFEGVEDGVLLESLKRYVQTLALEPSLSEIAYWADLIKWVSLGLVEPLPFEEAAATEFAGSRP